MENKDWNGSDKNVVCIEEDIKQLEDLILDWKSFVIGDKEHDEIYIKDIQAIEHLIKAYKELEEENKDLKNLANNKQWISPYYVAQNYIPVSLLEEKILEPMKEEHDKAIRGFIKRDIPQCIEDGGIAQELGYFIGKIEELLEKRK